jgi:hypothetical protein
MLAPQGERGLVCAPQGERGFGVCAPQGELGIDEVSCSHIPVRAEEARSAVSKPCSLG